MFIVEKKTRQEEECTSVIEHWNEVDIDDKDIHPFRRLKYAGNPYLKQFIREIESDTCQIHACIFPTTDMRDLLSLYQYYNTEFEKAYRKKHKTRRRKKHDQRKRDPRNTGRLERRELPGAKRAGHQFGLD